MISDVLSKVFADYFRIFFDKCNLCLHFVTEDIVKSVKNVSMFGKMNVYPYLCACNHLFHTTFSIEL